MHILFVDDAVDVRDLFCLAFARSGHTTQTAQDGEEALQFLTQNAEIVDAVVIDQGLPGASGVEVVQQLRLIEPLKSMPIILFTGYEEDDFEEQALQSGVTRVAYKPLSPSTLLAAIQDIIKRT